HQGTTQAYANVPLGSLPAFKRLGLDPDSEAWIEKLNDARMMFN
ncbi:histidine kinase, partial [Pseudomonas gingeri]|nr:histidine kinase [Pseudomonas gingeri]